jgi:hypothetical protein
MLFHMDDLLPFRTPRIERDITTRCDAVVRSMVRPAIYTILALHRHASTTSVSHSSTLPQTL